MTELLNESISTNNAVKEIRMVKNHGFEVTSTNGTVFARNIVMSLPAMVASKVIKGVNFNSLNQHLDLIRYPSLRVFHFLTLRSQAREKIGDLAF